MHERAVPAAWGSLGLWGLRREGAWRGQGSEDPVREEGDRAVREGRSSPTEESGRAALTDARGGIRRGRWGREEMVPVWGI